MHSSVNYFCCVPVHLFRSEARNPCPYHIDAQARLILKSHPRQQYQRRSCPGIGNEETSWHQRMGIELLIIHLAQKPPECSVKRRTEVRGKARTVHRIQKMECRESFESSVLQNLEIEDPHIMGCLYRKEVQGREWWICCRNGKQEILRPRMPANLPKARQISRISGIRAMQTLG